MRTLLYKNFLSTKLLSSCLVDSTEFLVEQSVAATAPVPEENQAFVLVLVDGLSTPEIVYCTNNPQTGSLTVLRGQEGTESRAWPAGTRAVMAVTAGMLNQIPDDQIQSTLLFAEEQAKTAQTAATTATTKASEAEQEYLRAKSTADAAGPYKVYRDRNLSVDPNQSADADLPNLSEGQWVRVLSDETAMPTNTTWVYQVVSGAFANGQRQNTADLQQYIGGLDGLSVQQYVPVDNLSTLLDAPYLQIHGLQIDMRSLCADRDAAGGRLWWDANADKADARGIWSIDPDAGGAFDGMIASADTWMAAQGSGAGIGCWRRVNATVVTPAMAGGDPLGQVDSAAAVQRAKSFCETVGASLTSDAGELYRLDMPVDLRRVHLHMNGSLNATFDNAPAIILGGRATNPNNPPQYLFEANSPTGTPANPTVRIIGAKGQRVAIDRTDHLDIYADSDSPVDSSCAYSEFWVKLTKRPITLSVNQNPADNSLPQWINENDFFLGRTEGFVINPSNYRHNHNRVWSGTFEGATLIDLGNGISNIFKGLRFEAYGAGGVPQVRFGADSVGNLIEYSWYSSFPSTSYELLEDLGRNNTVVSVQSTVSTRVPLIDLTADTVTAAPTRGVSNMTVSGDNVTVGSFEVFYISKLLPATATMRIKAVAVGVSLGGLRGGLYAYDQGMVEIAGNTGDYKLSGSGDQSFGTDASPSTNTKQNLLMIIEPAGADRAKYVRIVLRAGGNGLAAHRITVGIEYDASWGSRENEYGHITPEPTVIGAA